MKHFLKQYILFLVCLIIPIFLDGILSTYSYGAFITMEHQMAWQLFYIVFFSAMMFSPQRQYSYFAFTLGFIYDFYYSPIWVFYTTPFLITVYLFKILQPYLSLRNFPLRLLGVSVLLFFINTLQYIMGMIHHLEVPLFLTYLSEKVLPTLLLNSAFFCLLYPLLKKLFLVFNEE